MSSLDQNDLDSPFGSQQGGFVTARAGTYNYYLHIFHNFSERYHLDIQQLIGLARIPGASG